MTYEALFLQPKPLIVRRPSHWQWQGLCALVVALLLTPQADAVAHTATLTVTTADDDPVTMLSLRAAIARALPGDTIQFDSSLAGKTITLTHGRMP